MTIKNRFYNWRHKVKRLRTKGARNAGTRMIRGKKLIVKYDWAKPFTYVSPMYPMPVSKGYKMVRFPDVDKETSNETKKSGQTSGN